MTIFLDTNVLFSALMSQSGAAFELFRLAEKGVVKLMTSDQCLLELQSIQKSVKFLIPLQAFLKQYPLVIFDLSHGGSLQYPRYVFDADDAHVLAGAHQSQSEFLATFNIKDFRTDLIFQDFRIRVMAQGHFLQWLRGIGKYENSFL